MSSIHSGRKEGEENEGYAVEKRSEKITVRHEVRGSFYGNKFHSYLFQNEHNKRELIAGGPTPREKG